MLFSSMYTHVNNYTLCCTLLMRAKSPKQLSSVCTFSLVALHLRLFTLHVITSCGYVCLMVLLPQSSHNWFRVKGFFFLSFTCLSLWLYLDIGLGCHWFWSHNYSVFPETTKALQCQGECQKPNTAVQGLHLLSLSSSTHLVLPSCNLLLPYPHTVQGLLKVASPTGTTKTPTYFSVSVQFRSLQSAT